jgi:hypothetical protein
MALILQGSVSKNTVTKTVTVSDTTGDYNATTNPGGWGAPNPARADNALVLLQFSVVSDEVVKTTLIQDPTTVTFWEVVHTKDILFTFAMIRVDALASAPDPATKAAGYVFYNTTDQKFYQNNEGQTAFSEYSAWDVDDFSTSDKVYLEILILDDALDFIKADFMERADRQCSAVEDVDVITVEVLTECASDDFSNKNYITAQQNIDESNRILSNQT